MGEVLKLHGHRHHESEQIVIGQPLLYVDSEGYIYSETANGKECWLDDQDERIKLYS